MSRSYDGYNSQEDLTGRGSPDTIPEEYLVLFGYPDYSQTSHFREVIERLTIRGSEEQVTFIATLAQRLVGEELFSLVNLQPNVDLEFWPNARLRIFGRTRRIPLKPILGNLLETALTYLLYRLRRRLRLHVSYSLFTRSLYRLTRVTTQRFFNVDQPGPHCNIPIDWVLHLSFTDICSSLYTTYKHKASYIPERNWVREFFWNRRFLRELPNVTHSGTRIFHLLDGERLAWDEEEQTHI